MDHCIALHTTEQENKIVYCYIAETLKVIAGTVTRGAYDPPSLYNLLDKDRKTDEELQAENEREASAIISRMKGKFQK